MEDIIRKIKGLIAKSKSTNSEAEAMACAAKAKEMMDKYNIDHKAVDEDAITEFESARRVSCEWQRWVASASCRLFNCRLIMTKRNKLTRGGNWAYEDRFIFVGKEGDRITAELMTEYFLSTISTLSHKYVKEQGMGQNEKYMFQKACALRLSQRMIEMSSKWSDTNQLALVEEYIDQQESVTAGKKKNLPAISGRAARAGFERADDIGLNLQAGQDGKGNLQVGQVLKIGGK